LVFKSGASGAAFLFRRCASHAGWAIAVALTAPDISIITDGDGT
jgi:hypothetical protein